MTSASASASPTVIGQSVSSALLGMSCLLYSSEYPIISCVFSLSAHYSQASPFPGFYVRARVRE